MKLISARLFAALAISTGVFVTAPSSAATSSVGSSGAAATARFKAGELSRQTSSASAGLRNHGNTDIRILVWYPAATSEVESPVGAGPTERPLFLPGAIASQAAFADHRKRPLILLSHGFGGTARQMTWLGTALARSGYLVVAVDHPGTNGVDGITAEGTYAPWERVGDLTAALHLVLEDPVIGSHVDRDRMGVAGFSMGGFTASLTVGARADFSNFIAFCRSPKRDATCNKQVEFPADYSQMATTLDVPVMSGVRSREKADWQDARIKAAFMMAPALGTALDVASLRQIRLPVAVVYGTADGIVPPESNALVIGHSIPEATLIPLPGVEHYDFLSECSDAARGDGIVYCVDGKGTTRKATHERTSAAAIDFFDAALHFER